MNISIKNKNQEVKEFKNQIGYKERISLRLQLSAHICGRNPMKIGLYNPSLDFTMYNGDTTSVSPNSNICLCAD